MAENGFTQFPHSPIPEGNVIDQFRNFLSESYFLLKHLLFERKKYNICFN